MKGYDMKGYWIGMTLLTTMGLTAQSATVAYWRFETDGGASVTNNQFVASVDDSSGNGYTLTPLIYSEAARPRYKTNGSGVFTNRIPLTGQDNLFYQATEYAWMTNSAFSMPGDATFTVEGYFRITAADGSSHRTLVASALPGPNGFIIGVGKNAQPGNLSQFNINFPGWGAYTTTNANVTFGVSHHFAVVRSNAYTQLYLDGVCLLSTNTVGYGGTWSGISVGRRLDYDSTFPGYIDEVRISNDALAPNQFLNYLTPPPARTVIIIR
ncbi:MAG: LamG domain-containing protein [Kiritimatiellae bacterium]|nr:LamG domain-containing protein [Kiritimatiellia bacterium]